MWEFGEVRYSRSYDVVLENVNRFPGAKWFPGARLNFAENLLRYRDDRLALIFRGEMQTTAYMTYAELYDAVARLAKSLRASASTSVTASSAICPICPRPPSPCSPPPASARCGHPAPPISARLPRWSAWARSSRRSCSPPTVTTTKAKPSTRCLTPRRWRAAFLRCSRVVVVSYTRQRPDLSEVRQAAHWEDFLSPDAGLEIHFEQLPFDHPLFIMFSSGTTGKPKCMVQGAGGVLLNHLKELLAAYRSQALGIASSTSPPAVG